VRATATAVTVIAATVRAAATAVTVIATAVRAVFTLVRAIVTSVRVAWCSGDVGAGTKKRAWPRATPASKSTNERVAAHAAPGAGGSAGASAGFVRFTTGRPSSPTSLSRGWLRKGCWPNSTSFSDRVP